VGTAMLQSEKAMKREREISYNFSNVCANASYYILKISKKIENIEKIDIFDIFKNITLFSNPRKGWVSFAQIFM